MVLGGRMGSEADATATAPGCRRSAPDRAASPPTTISTPRRPPAGVTAPGDRALRHAAERDRCIDVSAADRLPARDAMAAHRLPASVIWRGLAARVDAEVTDRLAARTRWRGIGCPPR